MDSNAHFLLFTFRFSLFTYMKRLYRFLHPRFQSLFLEYKVAFQPRYGHGKPPHDLLYQHINARRGEYGALLGQVMQYQSQIQAIRPLDQEKDVSQPGWNNGFLPGLDISMLYAFLPIFQPKKYVEIGSGNSTKVARRAIQDNGLSTQIISIDPMPRAEIDHLADQVIRAPFEQTNFDFLFDLEPNDILFVDNSHRILPNSDAMVFFMEVLPKLKPGVIVHIHDIYLPYDYPQFMCDRFYSEQYGLAAFILANPNRFATLMPNYFVDQDPELRKILTPLWEHPNLQGVEQHGGSFWLQIKSDK